MEPKMVPEKDLIAIKQILKDKERKWESERASLTQEVTKLQNEVKITKANGEDSEEVARVKQMLIDQAEAVKRDREEYQKNLDSFGKREKEFRAKSHAQDLKSKGVEIDVESLLAEDDMDSKVKDILVEHLAKQNEELKKGVPSAENVFESGSGGILKVPVKDMTDEQFAAFEAKQKQMALSRK